MPRLRATSKDPVALFVVVHAETAEQVCRNADRAFESGADGIFLINHAISVPLLLGCYAAVRLRHPLAWIGLSFLGHSPAASLRLAPRDASGLWVGDAEIDEETGPSADALAFAGQRAASGWAGVYFGGVAFKHQRPVRDLSTAAAAAASYVDIVTTSGAGTGRAAPLEKIRTMKEALGDHPLAVASGITPENASDYLPWLEAVLVATGVSDSEAELNPQRIRQLADVVRCACSQGDR